MALVVNEFVVMVTELLSPLGTVTAKRLFGGWGLYCDGVVFALVAQDVLFLKGDDLCRAQYEAQDMAPFRPHGPDGMCLAYFEVPGDWLEDEDIILPYARIAFDAGLRAAAIKKSRPLKAHFL
jgi:DNA transformation protein